MIKITTFKNEVSSIKGFKWNIRFKTTMCNHEGSGKGFTIFTPKFCISVYNFKKWPIVGIDFSKYPDGELNIKGPIRMGWPTRIMYSKPKDEL